MGAPSFQAGQCIRMTKYVRPAFVGARMSVQRDMGQEPTPQKPDYIYLYISRAESRGHQSKIFGFDPINDRDRAFENRYGSWHEFDPSGNKMIFDIWGHVDPVVVSKDAIKKVLNEIEK